MKKLQEFIKNLAEEKKLPIFAIDKVVKHQFKFLKKCMQDDELPNIYLKNLGRFKVKAKRLEWMIEQIDDKEQLIKLKKAKDAREK
jgi:nucleoid DNA-binding protein